MVTNFSVFFSAFPDEAGLVTDFLGCKYMTPCHKMDTGEKKEVISVFRTIFTEYAEKNPKSPLPF